jgi:hypothetical protein
LIFIPPIRVTPPIHLIFLDMLILMTLISGTKCKAEVYFNLYVYVFVSKTGKGREF